MKTTFYFSRSHMKSFRPKRDNTEAFGTNSVRSLGPHAEYPILPSDQGVGALVWARGNKAIAVIRLWIVMSLLHALALIARGAEHEIVLQTGHGFLYSLDFSPDGRTLVSGGGMHNSFSSASAESTVKLWDVSTGLLTQNLFGHQATVRCVRYSPDGRMIASLDQAGVVKIWHVEDGKAFQTINGDEDSSMLAFSSDSKRLALNLKEKVRFWDIPNAQVHTTLVYSDKKVVTFTLRKDTSLIAAVCQSSSANGPQRSQSEVQIRETESGRILHNWGPRFAMESDGGVDRIGIVDQLALAFDPLSDLLVSSAKHSLLTWNTRTGEENSQLFDMAQQHQEVAISPKASILASADGGDNPTIAYRTLRLWDLKQSKVIKRISGDFSSVSSMSFSPDGSLLAVGFVDDTIRLWRTKNWELDRTFKRNALAAPRSVSISPDGKRLVSFSKGITTWDIVAGKLVSQSHGETDDYHKAPTFVAGYDLAAIRHSDRFSGQVTHVELWDGVSGQIRRILPELTNGLAGFAVSRDGGRIAVLRAKSYPESIDLQSGLISRAKRLPEDDRDTVMIFDLRDQKLLHHFDNPTDKGNGSRSASGAGLRPIAFSPDGKSVAAAGADDKVRVWSLQQGKLMHELPQAGDVNCVVFGPDSKSCATKSARWWRDGRKPTHKVILWSLESGQPIRELLSPDYVEQIAYSPDGKSIAGACHDSAVRLWEIASGKLTVLEGHSQIVNDVAYTPDGQILASASEDGTVRLWDVPSGELKAVLVTFENGDWLAYHPQKAYYNSSLQGDEMASLRLHNRPSLVYPLDTFRSELRREDDLMTMLAGPQPDISPKPMRLWYKRAHQSGLFVTVGYTSACGAMLTASVLLAWRSRGRRKETNRLREQLLEQERRSHSELEMRNRELLKARESAEKACVNAETANRAKSQFLANMSHEIRTPLNAILGYSQILRREATLPEAQRGFVETIERSGEHLLSLINDVLDLSKIEAGRMKLHEVDFDLTALVRDVSAMFQPRFEQKRLKWSVDWQTPPEGPVLVRGDEQKLRQVMINLLGNAVKFTERGEVSLMIVPGDSGNPRTSGTGSSWRFEVTDTGPGISGKAQGQIFEPFHQDIAGLRAGGTGLGLPIAARQLALMGGEIGVESKAGHGSMFWFSVPLRTTQANGPAVEDKTSRAVMEARRLKPGVRVRALVVDDVSANRDVLSRMLKSIGCEVLEAESGESALELTTRNRTDIVFMDIRMGGMDGMETMRRMREQAVEKSPNDARTRFVTLTASAFEQDRQRYLEAGFDEFIAKPFRFETLCECLAQLLQVEFQFDPEVAASNAIPSFGISWTLRLSKPLHRDLLIAAADGNITALTPLLSQVDALGGEGLELARYLRSCARAYDLEKLTSVLNELPHE